MLWVDITNLPHAMFFKEFIKGHETLVTSRDFGDLNTILDSFGINYTSVGRHGGKSPQDKLVESSKRVEGLTSVVSDNKIDAAISKQSVEMPRVAFGLGVPVLQFIDNEYGEKQNRIVLPLCERIIVPEALKVDRLIEQGATESQILKVNCIFEATHVKNFKPNPDVPKALGLKEYIVIRPEPYMASYFNEGQMTQELVELLKDKFQVVILPRGNEEYNAMTLRNVDSLSLMYHAKAVLSGGGTMTREAALMGTPAISFYPQDQLGVDEFLIESGLLFHSTKIEEIKAMIDENVKEKQKLQELAAALINTMEDPFEKLESEISNLAGRSS